MAEQTIPVVDLNQFTHGDASHQAAFVSTLGEALVEYGFVAVDNHGVDRAALAAMYREIRTFFDLPKDVKRQYERPEGGRQRGYTALGQEHAKYHDVPDIKEFWHVGPEIPVGHPLKGIVPDNIWPTEVPGFAEAAQGLFATLHSSACVLLRAIARFLDAEEDEFIRMVDGANTILRMIRYPVPEAVTMPKDAVWAAQHEDINVITLLPEATDAGLQLLRRDGTWMPITPIPNQVIADSGDMLERLTNGLIPSTTHRVMAPERVEKPRYSMPYFVHAVPDYVLTPLPGTVTDARPRRWEDVTAHEYLMERLAEIGLATKDS